MNTKNLLKTTVASFLLFGLSAISAKAMEPKQGDEFPKAPGIPAKSIAPTQNEGPREAVEVSATSSKLMVSEIQFPDGGYRFRLMSDDLKPRELGLFCIGDELCCGIHGKQMQIKKGDNDSNSLNYSNGLPLEIFGRILKTVQNAKDPTYVQAGLAQEQEGKLKAADNFYNGAFEQITPEDKKALLQYILLRDRTLMIYIANGDMPKLTEDEEASLKFASYAPQVLETDEECAERLAANFYPALLAQEELQKKLLESMKKNFIVNHPIPHDLAFAYAIAKLRISILQERFFVDCYYHQEPTIPYHQQIAKLYYTLDKIDKELPEGLRTELDVLSEPLFVHTSMKSIL